MRHLEHGTLAELLEALLGVEPNAESDAQLIEALSDIRPEDIAEVLGDFGPDPKVRIFVAVGADHQGSVLMETDPTSRLDIVEALPSTHLVQILHTLEPDDAADLVEVIPDETRPGLLSQLEPEAAEDVRDLLQHESESAGGLMTSDLITVAEDRTARAVLETVQQEIDTEVMTYVYVVDERNRLQGVVSIRELIAANPSDRVGDFMQRDVIYAEAGDDQEEVANLARKYNLSTIPIVDAQRCLLGVATIDDIVDVISEEADEDIYRLAGSPASHPAQQPILRRALVRTPWLMISLVAGFVMAYMGGEQIPNLTDPVLLVAFLPLVVGLSGGAGTQSATLIARGLATGEVDISRTGRVFFQELWIGLTIGLFMGAVVMACLVGLLQFSDAPPFSANFPVAVSLGLTTGILLATICGTAIPVICEKVNIDPALVAGPFVTGFNDVVGSFTFLAIGNAVLA